MMPACWDSETSPESVCSANLSAFQKAMKLGSMLEKKTLGQCESQGPTTLYNKRHSCRSCVCIWEEV